jgi:hypothetical protein
VALTLAIPLELALAAQVRLERGEHAEHGGTVTTSVRQGRDWRYALRRLAGDVVGRHCESQMRGQLPEKVNTGETPFAFVRARQLQRYAGETMKLSACSSQQQ